MATTEDARAQQAEMRARQEELQRRADPILNRYRMAGQWIVEAREKIRELEAMLVDANDDLRRHPREK